ncbi:MAG: hypothetical protein ACOY93_06595 [Bacillota bacterium]
MRHQAERGAKAAETLIVRGILYDDGRFEPLGCHSAYVTGPRRAPIKGDYALELVDGEQRLLVREPVAVREPTICVNISPGLSLVEGRLPLLPGAKEVRIVKGEVPIRTLPLGEPPQIQVEWKPKHVDRRKKHPLLLHFSRPAPDAYIKVFYQWGENRYMTAALTRPVERLELDFRGLPGGDECHIIVAYTSGLRTAAVTTHAFSVSPLPPSLEIVRPREQAVFAPWHPITLEARMVDRQGEGSRQSDLLWRLNGKRVSRGWVGCLQSLPEGNYELEVQLPGKEGIAARRTLVIKRPKEVKGIPASEWD